jgi:hypothetical protein
MGANYTQQPSAAHERPCHSDASRLALPLLNDDPVTERWHFDL